MRALLLLLVGSMACASTSSSNLSLVVDSAAQIDGVPNAPPVPSDHMLIAVDLTITNDSADAVPLALGLFSVVTANGVQYPASLLTALYAEGCDTNASLTAGHAIRCSVIFETPTQDVADEITYAPPDLTPASAPLSVALCTLCNGVCVDVSTDPKNCGACGTSVGDGTCVDGAPVCASGATECNGWCAKETPVSCGCPAHVCGSYQNVPADGCHAGHCTITLPIDSLGSCAQACAAVFNTSCYEALADYDCNAHASDSVDCATTPPSTIGGCHWSRSYCSCGVP
jgi:hypothetical protein